jgi:DNA polymerase-3 subunit gamma/tau
VAYQVLSRKWRPKKFQDVVGQEHVTRSLQNAVLKEKLGHAYLLTGTRGIGKTSVARIFAKSLRCENRLEDANPCNSCEGCLEFESGSSMNVLEIDGASNNSVDDVRELVNNVQTLPTFGKYKVYIIDEVHMLSTQAFNALLKTLEEPPGHSIFLLATTEAHKLLDTVLSRCIRFDFRNASIETLVAHIKRISEKEGISFSNEKLIEVLANQGQGSFRDTLSLMDQVLSFSENNEITEESMSTALGLAKISAIKSLGEALLMGQSSSVVSHYSEMLHENISVKNISLNLLDFFFELATEIDNPEKLELSSDALNFIKNSTIDEIFWIYESLSRDFKWALESPLPEKTINIVLQKHARRGDILQGTGLPVSETVKKKVISEEVVSKTESPLPSSEIEQATHDIPKESPTASLEESQQGAQAEKPKEELKEENLEKHKEEHKEELKNQLPEEKTWHTFESFLRIEIPAIYAELEQGNIIEELEIHNNQAVVNYGFSESSKLFYEHLISGDGKEKIESLMMTFFNVEKATLNLVFLDKKKAEENEFYSKSEIREKERQETLEQKEANLRNHPIIKEAEKLFGKNIEKVKIEEE